MVAIATGVWANVPPTDAEGYYLLDSPEDWEAFATLVVTNPTANAKMTADIDLGESQAMLGDSEHEGNPTYAYQGTFDGQGYTLTVHYTGTSQTAPFAMLQKATIRNIHVDGTINNTSGSQPSVIARVISGTTTVENVWSSVITTDTRTGWDEAAALVGCVDGYKSGHVVMRDCLFTGTVNSKGDYNGCFVGYINSPGSALVSSCLSLGTFNYTGGSYDIARGTYTNCFVKQWPGAIPANMQATDEKLASGEIAYRLQAGRGKMFWGQTIGVDPVPVMTNDESKRVYRSASGFTNDPNEATLQYDADGYYLLGSVDDWKAFATMVDDGFAEVNVRMTADIDLGDDQTMIGEGHYNNESLRKPYRGIFDGQGHTLTIHYVTEEVVKKYTDAGVATPRYLGCAPFCYVWGGTIRNLHTAGTITATHEGTAGIVGWTNGNTLIEHCHSSVNITYTNDARGSAGLTYNSYNNDHVLTINDCLYDGTLTAGTNKTGSAGFVVYSWAGTTNISNSLLTATYANGLGSSDCATFIRNRVGTINRCFYLTALGTAQGTQITEEQLASGEIAYKLQAARADMFWGQTIGVDLVPVLTTDESKRVYRTLTGFSNTPDAEELQIDAEGYYLLGNANDWKRFAMLIDDGFANVNARMTDDIDLGDDQTMIGESHYNDASYRKAFSGIFDGQGHTLTVHYVTDEVMKKYTEAGVAMPGYLGCAPFHYVWDGIIRNLHTAGTITATHKYAAGIVGWTNGTTLIENCHSSVNITFPEGNYGMAGIACDNYNNNHVLTIRDCVYDGTMTAGTDKRYSAGFVIYHDYGNINVINSLLTATYANGLGTDGCATFVRNGVGGGIVSNSYFLNPLGAIQGNQATAEELANGKVAFYLQAGRTDLFWGQKIGTDPLPVLTNDESKRVYRAAEGYTNDPTQAIADQDIIPLTYTRDADNNLTITGFDPGFTPPANYLLVIPDDIDGSPVVGIANEAFRKKTNITSLYIGKNVKTIGASAFRECTALTAVIIPKSVTTMGTSVFEECTGLTSAAFEDGFTMNYIPDWTFYNTRFTSFTIPASVQTINKGAFSNNTALAAIDFPATVTKLGEEAFRNCSALTAVTIPATITAMDRNVFWNSGVETADVSCAVLGQGAFYECAKLETVTLNEGLTTIGVGAFHGCKKLASVTIPKTVTTLLENAFRECSLLETVTFEKDIQLETIGNHAFRSCEKLNDVVLPGSLRLIGEWSFSYCTALENLTIEEGIANISRDAFQYSGMKNVVLPSTLDFIGVNLFHQCNQLEVLDLSKCVNVWELYSYTSLRGGSYNITYGVPAITKIIMPPYAQATLGANDEVKDIEFNLTKDADDFYLINNADDWDKFVAYSRANPAINGRITADLDLTAHPGKLGVGNGESNYITWQGTLDGQGHTLTISYKNGKEFTGALIAYAENATVKNLHVKGSVDAYYRVVGGIVGFVKPGSTLTMQDCESSVNFTVTPSTTNMHVAGFIGQGKTGEITLTDCLYNGTVTGTSSFRYAAGFMGWMENGGHIAYNYCLNNGTFTGMDMNYAYTLGATQSKGMTTAAVCYGNVDGGAKISPESLYTTVNTDQLKTGMVAYRLQGGRDEQHWGQKLDTDPAPRLTTEDGTRVYRGQTYTNEVVEYTGLQKDADDYYLIGSPVDWEEFCTLVQEFPLSNARMTDDFEVADNSMIGTSAMAFSGIFDGQGHTLTVNYAATENYCAPFNFINGATIKNLHTAGQISIGYRFGGGIVASSKGTNNMQNCWSSVNIVSSLNGDATHGGLVAYQENGTLTITNCLFDGSIVGEQSNRCGGFIGYRNGTLTIENSLCAPTAITINEYDCGTLVRNGGGTITNCFFTQSLNNRDQGVQATAEQLASGEIAYKLQGKNDELIWAQTIGTDEQPQLVVFNPTAKRVYRSTEGYTNNPDEAVIKVDAEGYYMLKTLNDWKTLSELVAEGEEEAKARMYADIDLGDDQTKIGNRNAAELTGYFKGIFDGQGHTLTIQYVQDGPQGYNTAPFPNISCATIKNVHFDGTITNDCNTQPSIVGNCRYGTSYLENLWSSVTTTSNSNHEWTEAAAFVSCVDGYKQGHLVMSDCLFTGAIKGSPTWAGVFIGYINSGGSAAISNCLSTGTFQTGSNPGIRGDYTNCYVKEFTGSIPANMQCTAETLADGTVATALQAGRAEEVWVQGAKAPMLKLFYKPYTLGDANGDGNVTITDAVAIVNYILGNKSDNFNFDAADVNKDGAITITDAVGVVNIILSNGSAGSAPKIELEGTPDEEPGVTIEAE